MWQQSHLFKAKSAKNKTKILQKCSIDLNSIFYLCDLRGNMLACEHLWTEENEKAEDGRY